MVDGPDSKDEVGFQIKGFPLTSGRPKNAYLRFDLLSVYSYGHIFLLRDRISSKI